MQDRAKVREMLLYDVGIGRSCGGRGDGRWCRRGWLARRRAPRLKLAAQRLADDAEQIAGGLTHALGIEPRLPFVEHRLAQRRIDLLQRR